MGETQTSKPRGHEALGVWPQLPFLDFRAYQPWAPSARSRLRNTYDETTLSGPDFVGHLHHLFLRLIDHESSRHQVQPASDQAL